VCLSGRIGRCPFTITIDLWLIDSIFKQTLYPTAPPLPPFSFPGTFTLFQETYRRATFKRCHPYGPKSDYNHRLLTMDRAQIGGLDDVGIGALFGLDDYRCVSLCLSGGGWGLRVYACIEKRRVYTHTSMDQPTPRMRYKNKYNNINR
jgi:hypothetical protein